MGVTEAHYSTTAPAEVLAETPKAAEDEKRPESVRTAVASELDIEVGKNTRATSIWVVVGSALANFSDGYQNQLVNIMTCPVRSEPQANLDQSSSTNVVFKHLESDYYTSSVQTRISNALLVGAVIGILMFGFTSDRWSRKGGMFITSGMVTIGSLMATLVFQVNGTSQMLWYLTIARGLSGVGVGGEYPASAAAAIEGSNEVRLPSFPQTSAWSDF